MLTEKPLSLWSRSFRPITTGPGRPCWCWPCRTQQAPRRRGFPYTVSMPVAKAVGTGRTMASTAPSSRIPRDRLHVLHRVDVNKTTALPPLPPSPTGPVFAHLCGCRAPTPPAKWQVDSNLFLRPTPICGFLSRCVPTLHSTLHVSAPGWGAFNVSLPLEAMAQPGTKFPFGNFIEPRRFGSFAS